MADQGNGAAIHGDYPDEYVVERIKAHSIRDGTLYYLVKWLGYDSPGDDTWEPESHLAGCLGLLTEYQLHLPEFATVVSHL
jgi:hypothetical protein